MVDVSSCDWAAAIGAAFFFPLSRFCRFSACTLAQEAFFFRLRLGWLDKGIAKVVVGVTDVGTCFVSCCDHGVMLVPK